jgi:hypothetical protein
MFYPRSGPETTHPAILFCGLGISIYRRTPRDARFHLTHENPEFIEYSTNHKSTNMGLIKEALAALDLLEPGERPNYTKVAKTYGVYRLTLLKKYRGIM